MESFYKDNISKCTTNEFLAKAYKLDFSNKIDLLVIMTAKTREKHISTVMKNSFFDLSVKEQVEFIAEIRRLTELRDLFSQHIKDSVATHTPE